MCHRFGLPSRPRVTLVVGLFRRKIEMSVVKMALRLPSIESGRIIDRIAWFSMAGTNAPCHCTNTGSACAARATGTTVATMEGSIQTLEVEELFLDE